MKYHGWDETGIDPKSGEPNIWTCRKCGMVMAKAKRRDGRAKPGTDVLSSTDIEYSSSDGEVIALNPTHMPPCTKAGVW